MGIHILNPECVRIPWVLAPKNFHVQNFRVRSDLQKSSIFHRFLLPPPKKKYRARVPTILMPQTFPIASLNRYTPKVDLVPIVWHTAPPKVRIPRIHCRQKRLFLGVFLEKKSFPGKTVDFWL